MEFGTRKILFACTLSALSLPYSHIEGLDIQNPPSPAQIAFQKYFGTAIIKGRRRTPSDLLKAIAKKTGITSMGAATYVYLATHPITYQRVENILPLLAHSSIFSLLLATSTELYKEYQAASPEWLEQIKKIDTVNISENTITIGKKTYLLAKSFDHIEQSGYANGVKQPEKGAYEIDFMPNDAEVVDLFFALETWFNKADPKVKDEIAFITLRPTPYLYSSHNILTRQTLPRIIIGLKYRDTTDINRKDKAMSVLISLVDFLVPINTSELDKFSSTKEHPRYSQHLGSMIFGAFGNNDDKDIHPENYERHMGWFFPYPDDMAYPKGREKTLKLPTIHELLVARNLKKPFSTEKKGNSENVAQQIEQMLELEGEPTTRALIPLKTPVVPPPAPLYYQPPSPIIPQTPKSPSIKPKTLSLQELTTATLVSGTAEQMIGKINELYSQFITEELSIPIQKKKIEQIRLTLNKIQARGGKTLETQLSETDAGRKALLRLEQMEQALASREQSESVQPSPALTTQPIVPTQSSQQDLIDEMLLLKKEIEDKQSTMTEKERIQDIILLEGFIEDFKKLPQNVSPSEEQEFMDIALEITDLLKTKINK